MNNSNNNNANSNSLDSLTAAENNPIAQRLLENASSLTYNNPGKGFSGLEKEPENLVKYRAYSIRGRKYNQQDVLTFDTVILYELWVEKHQVNKQAYEYHRLHPNEPPAKMVGGERRVVGVLNPQWYQENGAEHISLPIKLLTRKFDRETEDELALWIQESKDDEDIDVIIEQEIGGVAPIREITEIVMEVLHPVIPISKEAKEGDKGGEEYTPISCAHYLDCPICYSFHEFTEPKLFLLGESIHSQEFKEARARYRERKMRVKKLKKMRTFLKALTVLDTTWSLLDTMEDSDYNEEIIKQKARAEVLGKGKEEEGSWT
ncbi:MAG: hypothetical protein M3114_08560 [Thermoproteota archaeon]|nr:hypothetical protein [Thermoproteota archaeon]